MTQRRIKALVKLDEPSTCIRRMLDAPLRVYPDSDAGYGQRYILQLALCLSRPTGATWRI